MTDGELDDFKRQIKSNLKETLPIQLAIGAKGVAFAVHKKGPGSKKLSQKANAIAYFVAERIEFEYIEAIRTAASAQKVIDSLVEKELGTIESAPAYQSALAKVQELQQPVLDALSNNIKRTMVNFLPAIKNVRMEITAEQRFAALRRSAKMVIDDGTPTQLQYKGDGVQSLAALALLRHASESSSQGKNFVIAVEEPESHLHPSAMHGLRSVLQELAEKYQIVITTHSPLFVDRTNIHANILVNKNKAVPAESIEQIRSILGVRASDNLRLAELVLIVEGDDDRVSIRALLREISPTLKESIDNGRLAFETLGGGSNLSYVIGLVRDALLCNTHCFLDDDECGRNSYKKAKAEGLVGVGDVNLASVLGMQNAELEDLYEVTFYKDLLWNEFKVAVDNPKFKSNKKKWSDRLKEVFKVSGKPWDDVIEADVKVKVAALVASNPKSALNSTKKTVITNLSQALEARLTKSI